MSPGITRLRMLPIHGCAANAVLLLNMKPEKKEKEHFIPLRFGIERHNTLESFCNSSVYAKRHQN